MQETDDFEAFEINEAIGSLPKRVDWRGGVPMTGRPAAASEAEEFQLAIPADRYREMMDVLYPAAEHPYVSLHERGVIAVITRSTGRRRVSYTVHEVVPPNPGYPEDGIYIESLEFFPGSGGLNFGHRYRSRAMDRAIEVSEDLVGDQRAGLLMIHTHGEPPFRGLGRSPIPSRLDEESAEENLWRYAQSIGRDGDGPMPPMAAGIVTAENDGRNGARPGDNEWSIRAYQYESLEGQWGDVSEPTITWVDGVRVVGHDEQHLGGRVLTKYAANRGPDRDVALGPAGGRGKCDIDTMDASIQLWGETGQSVLAGLRVGLVGCGGVGSILGEQLAQDGIAELVAVDFDVIEESNRNRMQSATEADATLNRRKVTHVCAKAYEVATHPDFSAHAVFGSIVEDSVEYGAIPDLVDCDLVLVAADHPLARRIADDLAYAHCIPSINGGAALPPKNPTVEQFAADGRPVAQLSYSSILEVMDAGPGTACFECQGLNEDLGCDPVESYADHPDADEISETAGDTVQEEEENSGRDAAVKAPNEIVAGRMGLRLRSFVLGLLSRHRGTWRHFPSPGGSDWAPAEPEDAQCDDCKRPDIVGLGDGYRPPTRRDEILRDQLDE